MASPIKPVIKPVSVAVLLGVAVAIWAGPALAQDHAITFGGDSLSGQSLLLIGVVTLLSLAPGIAVMVTCFPFIVTVLSILRQAIGLQQSPPNMMIVSLSLFLTWFIMEPVMMQAWTDGIQPFVNDGMDLRLAFDRTVAPFQAFMAGRTNPATFLDLAALRPETSAVTDMGQAPLSLLVPSFMLSEISRAFEIGFLVYLPFLVIDMVVSAVLMAMGMMMVPPAVVALPFKLAFFVVADGWTLVSGALVRSYM